MSRLSLSKISPFLVFITLEVLAIHFIFGKSLYQSGLDNLLKPICPHIDTRNVPSTLQTYTGIRQLDVLLCTLVSFFQPAIHPTPLPVLWYFLGTHGPLVVVPLVESKRAAARFPVTLPAFAWVIYQLVTIGVGVPWYWLSFIVTEHHRETRTGHGRISRLEAEGIAVGFVLGSVLPLLAMVALNRPNATAVWQAFPLLTVAFRIIYIVGRKHSTTRSLEAEGGSGVLEVLYVWLFFAAALTHIRVIKTLELQKLLYPVYPVTSIREGVDIFLKWDLVMGFITSMVASCWFAERRWHLVILIFWNVFGGISLGPGAVLAGIAFWREKSRKQQEY